MDTLFTVPSGRAPREFKSGRLDYVVQQHRNNLNRVINYYRAAHYAVESNHLLVRLIQNLPGLLYPDLEWYYDLISDTTEEIAQPLNLTSAIRIGRLRSPRFLNTTGAELIIAHSETGSLVGLAENWHILSPLRWLWHPVANFNLDLSFDRQYKGYSVLQIDIPLLAIQYRFWQKHNRLTRPEAPESVMHFIARFVLPNSLSSFADIAWFNACCQRFYGLPLESIEDNHPFYLNAFTEATSVVIDQLLLNYTNAKVSYPTFLEGVTAISNPTLQSAFTPNEYPRVRPLIAAYSLARLPLIEHWLAWDNLVRKPTQQQARNTLKQRLRAYQSDKVWTRLETAVGEPLQARLERTVWPYL